MTARAWPIDSCCAWPLRVSAQASTRLRGGPPPARPPRPCPRPCPAGAAFCCEPAADCGCCAGCANASTPQTVTVSAATVARLTRYVCVTEPFSYHEPLRIEGTKPRSHGLLIKRFVASCLCDLHREAYPWHPRNRT